MSDIVTAAVAALSEKLSGGIPGTAKFVIEGEGALIIDGSDVRAGDDEADVTLTAFRPKNAPRMAVPKEIAVCIFVALACSDSLSTACSERSN